jgi:hypothetical protein
MKDKAGYPAADEGKSVAVAEVEYFPVSCPAIAWLVVINNVVLLLRAGLSMHCRCTVLN